MSDINRRQLIFDMADQFIAIANELIKSQDIGTVGASFRYAAARFAAFEADQKSDDLAKHKEHALAWFVDEYRKMLLENIDELIEENKST
jgi:hypothetical protein